MREADANANPTFEVPRASTSSDLKALERALEQASVELSSIRLESSEEEEVEEEVVVQKVAAVEAVAAPKEEEAEEPKLEVAAPKKAFWFF